MRNKRFREFIRNNDVKYILAEFGYAGLLIYREARRLNIPTYVYFRGADASSWLSSRKYVRRLRAMMGNIDGVFAVSRALIDNLHQHGVSHKNEFVLPSGVDTASFRPGEKDPNLISSVGRFIGKKGHKTSIAAFKEVCDEFPNLRLEIVGDGDLLEACKELAERKGIADRVVFHGAKSHDFVRDLLSRSVIYLQHSVTDSRSETEGIPTALQEAMATGNAVISTRHGGIPEHVQDGVTGMLLDENDLAGYVAKLRMVLKDADLRNKLATHAREYAVKHLDKRLVTGTVEAIVTGKRDLIATS